MDAMTVTWFDRQPAGYPCVYCIVYCSGTMHASEKMNQRREPSDEASIPLLGATPALQPLYSPDLAPQRSNPCASTPP